jgi:hypothetical protein
LTTLLRAQFRDTDALEVLPCGQNELKVMIPDGRRDMPVPSPHPAVPTAAGPCHAATQRGRVVPIGCWTYNQVGRGGL